MMKRLLVNILFFLYRKDYYQPLSKIEVDVMLTKLALTPGLERFPDYLEQCANTARNQYLYNNDPILKGTILGLSLLRDQIVKKIPKAPKKELTQEEKVSIMRGRGA